MDQSQTVGVLLGRLWLHFSGRRRGQFFLLLVLMIVASFAEILSIGAVLPFLGALTSPNQVFEHHAAQFFIQNMGITSADQLLFPLTVLFGIAALLAGAMRVLLLWLTTRLSFATGADLGISIYRRTLYQPYAVHVARNSSEVINGISSKANGVIYSVITPILTIINSIVMLVAILVVMLSVNLFITLVAFCSFGSIYGFLIWNTRAQKIRNSHHIARESTRVIQCLQEGLGGIRDVLIDGSQSVYCENYRNADLLLRQAQGNNQVLSQTPRYVMEALGIALIAMLAFVLAKQSGGVASAIPILGALALGAQRLLPVMQQLYGAWSSIHGSQASLQDTLMLLDQPLPEYADLPVALPIPFEHQISLNGLSFRYAAETPLVLNNLNLTIAKGGRVGFIGTTGSGKSTLLDIVMGLLQPTLGSLEIDGQPVMATNCRSWQARIAHVPQVIFLADSSIEENIAFGVPKSLIDHERVRFAARQAQIADVIEEWPAGYQTSVGERGVRLSGGQRQRIGIARALYKRADVIVFDEATSALDSETEGAVMQAIESLSGNLTILIIAHRLSTLKNCTEVVELADGAVCRVGKYQDVVTEKA
jgi:ATP-binding cassette subfamily B protein